MIGNRKRINQMLNSDNEKNTHCVKTDTQFGMGRQMGSESVLGTSVG